MLCDLHWTGVTSLSVLTVRVVRTNKTLGDEGWNRFKLQMLPFSAAWCVCVCVCARVREHISTCCMQLCVAGWHQPVTTDLFSNSEETKSRYLH